jgi:hypothetical protein
LKLNVIHGSPFHSARYFRSSKIAAP